MKQNEYLEKFMAQFPFEGLTYDDVSLVLQYADFLPDSTDLSTRLTSRIRINIPFLSAAMDTVTEAPMAVAMAMQGGIGVIHKNLTVEQQADQVSQVKHHLNGLIHSPIAFHAGQTLDEILAERRKAWKPKPVKYKTGVLRLFSELAASPMKGAYINFDGE